MLTYLKVDWHHDGEEDPVILYHEMDERRCERRRVELFKNGKIQRSSEADPDAAYSLSLEPLPSIEQIDAQPEFHVEQIDRATFDDVWERAAD